MDDFRLVKVRPTVDDPAACDIVASEPFQESSSPPTNATSAATSQPPPPGGASTDRPGPGPVAERVIRTAQVAAGIGAEGRRWAVGGTLVVPGGPDRWPQGDVVFVPLRAGK